MTAVDRYEEDRESALETGTIHSQRVEGDVVLLESELHKSGTFHHRKEHTGFPHVPVARSQRGDPGSAHLPPTASAVLAPLAWVWGGSKHSGIACMVTSSLSYSLMGLLVKLLSVAKIPSNETMLVRSLVVSLLAGWGLRRARHPLLGSPPVFHLVIARAVIGAFALSAFFYSIQVLTLRDATVLNFTMPVFTALMAAVFLKERWGSREIADGQLKGDQLLSMGSSVGVGVAVAGAALGAASYIILRLVGKHGEPPLVCVFAFAAFSAPMAAFGLLFQDFVLPTVLELLGLMTVGLTAFAAQVFLTRGLQLEAAARATAFQYVKVLGTYMLGVAFLGEVPSVTGAMGGLLIAGSAAFITYSGH